jgi:hypothetical protein
MLPRSVLSLPVVDSLSASDMVVVLEREKDASVTVATRLLPM